MNKLTRFIAATLLENLFVTTTGIVLAQGNFEGVEPSIEHVAGNEDSVNIALRCQGRNAFDGLKPFLAKESRGVALYRTEGLAELPIRCV